MQRNCTPIVPQQFFEQKDCVMKTATKIQENAEDIYAEAQIINEERANEEFVDAEEETADEIQD